MFIDCVLLYVEYNLGDNLGQCFGFQEVCSNIYELQ